MARMSGVAVLAAMLALVAPAASAQQHCSQSDGTGPAATNHDPGVTTGSARLGTGQAAIDSSTNTDAAVKAENQLLDRKLKSICRGC
jgi:opacity protein-like surface antigen